MDNKRLISPWLLAGDALIILLFVFIGQRDHDMPIIASMGSLLTTALAVIVPWALAAGPLGALRLPGEPRSWFGRIIAAWLIAAPLGVVIRALTRGITVIPVAFMLVMLGLGVLSMLLWRAIVYVWVRRRAATA